jgi:hypothetical protein
LEAADDHDTIIVRDCVQVHLGAGIGNIVLATPLLVALYESGLATDVVLAADYSETADLLRPWSAVREIFRVDEPSPCRKYSCVIPAIPPFYWRRYAKHLTGMRNVVVRPPEALFYEDEQEFYLSFARRLGYAPNKKPSVCLPIVSSELKEASANTLIVAPGCKTGEMAAKRWPYYSELADEFLDVAVVGTADDLRRYDGKQFQFGPHVKMLVDKLTLRRTAEVIAASGAFVGNDSGLSHIAAAVGTPTIMIFGPTPNHTLGKFPQNVRILRRGSSCEPCWFSSRFCACGSRIDCLDQLSVQTVVGLLGELSFLGERPRPTCVC